MSRPRQTTRQKSQSVTNLSSQTASIKENPTHSLVLSSAMPTSVAAIGQDYRLITIQRSQYSVGSVSGCTLFACEAAYQLLVLGRAPSEALLSEILESSKSYQSVQHLDFEDVLAKNDNYCSVMEIADRCQIEIQNFGRVFEKILYEYESRRPFAVLVTKAPESIAIVVLEDGRIILFDSHKRGSVDGSYFFITANLNSIVRHVESIWPRTHLTDEFENYQLSMLNSMDLFVVRSLISNETCETLQKLLDEETQKNKTLLEKLANLQSLAKDYDGRFGEISNSLRQIVNEHNAAFVKEQLLVCCRCKSDKDVIKLSVCGHGLCQSCARRMLIEALPRQRPCFCPECNDESVPIAMPDLRVLFRAHEEDDYKAAIKNYDLEK